jgi:hypothetical protein
VLLAALIEAVADGLANRDAEVIPLRREDDQSPSASSG